MQSITADVRSECSNVPIEDLDHHQNQDAPAEIELRISVTGHISLYRQCLNSVFDRIGKQGDTIGSFQNSKN